MSDSFHDEEPARLYRDAPRAEPPPALDAAILAAARREVGAGPRRDPASPRAAFLRQWRIPLSVAAVVVISGSLVFLVESERAVDSGDAAVPSEQAVPQRALRAREPADAKEAAPTPPPIPASPAPPAVDSRTALRLRQAEPAKPQAPRSEPPAIRSTPDKADSAGTVPEIRANASRAEGKLESTATDRPSAMQQRAPPAAWPAIQGSQPAEPAAAFAPAPSPIVPPTPGRKPEAPGERYISRQDAGSATIVIRGTAGGVENAAELGAAAKAGPAADSPEAWLARIETLRREGKVEEAERSLAEFRKRYPDYPLPVHLKTP